MSWKELVKGTLGVISVFTFLGTLIQRVNAGVGSEAENQLVANIKKVVSEYEVLGLTEEKKLEQLEITEKQRKFDEKWGVKKSGHDTDNTKPE